MADRPLPGVEDSPIAALGTIVGPSRTEYCERCAAKRPHIRLGPGKSQCATCGAIHGYDRAAHVRESAARAVGGTPEEHLWCIALAIGRLEGPGSWEACDGTPVDLGRHIAAVSEGLRELRAELARENEQADAVLLRNEATLSPDAIRRRLAHVRDNMPRGIVIVGDETAEILAPKLASWRVGGDEITEAEIASALDEALEANPGPASNLRSIDEGDLRRDRLRAFVGDFSIWEIDGEVIAKRGHDFDHADPGVLLEPRRDVVFTFRGEPMGCTGDLDEARDAIGEATGGRPDFEGFADALDGEADWTEALHRSGPAADKAQATTDAAGLRKLAERVRSVGRRRGYL